MKSVSFETNMYKNCELFLNMYENCVLYMNIYENCEINAKYEWKL